jgi:hypothetical protein
MHAIKQIGITLLACLAAERGAHAPRRALAPGFVLQGLWRLAQQHGLVVLKCCAPHAGHVVPET